MAFDNFLSNLGTALTAQSPGGQYLLQQQALQQLAPLMNSSDFQANPGSALGQLASNQSPLAQELAKSILGYQLDPQKQILMQRLNMMKGRTDNSQPNVGGITNPGALPQDNNQPPANPPLNANPALNMTPIPPGGPNPAQQYQTQMPSALSQLPTPQAPPGQSQSPELAALQAQIDQKSKALDAEEQMSKMTGGIMGDVNAAKAQLTPLTDKQKILQEAQNKPLDITQAGLVASQQNAIPAIEDIRKLAFGPDGKINRGTLLMARPGIGMPIGESTAGVPAVTPDAQMLQAKMSAVAAAIVKSDGTRLNEAEKAKFIQKEMPGPNDSYETGNKKLDDIKNILTQSTKLAGKSYNAPANQGGLPAESSPQAQPTMIKNIGGVNYHQINGKWFKG